MRYRRARAIMDFAHRGYAYERDRVYEVPNTIFGELLLENRVDPVEDSETTTQPPVRVPVPRGMPRPRKSADHAPAPRLPRIEIFLGETPEDFLDDLTWRRATPEDEAVHAAAEAQGREVIRDRDGKILSSEALDAKLDELKRRAALDERAGAFERAGAHRETPERSRGGRTPGWLKELRLVTETIGGIRASLYEDDRGDEPVLRLRRVVLLTFLERERTRLDLRSPTTILNETLAGLPLATMRNAEHLLVEWEPYVRARADAAADRDLEADLRDLLDALDDCDFALEPRGLWWNDQLPQLSTRRDYGDGTTVGERSLVILLASAMDDTEIARALQMSADSVRTKIKRLYDKYEARGTRARDELLRRFGMPRLP